jgi:hypothetical protein
MSPRGLILSVALTVALVACRADPSGPTLTNAGDPPSSAGGSEAVVITLLAGDRDPAGTLSFGGHSQEGALGTNCWDEMRDDIEGVSHCADAAGPSAPARPVVVPAGTPVVLDSRSDADTAEGSIGVLGGGGDPYHYEVVKRLGRFGKAVLDVPPGAYVIDVFATWPRGEGQIDFSVTIT